MDMYIHDAAWCDAIKPNMTPRDSIRCHATYRDKKQNQRCVSTTNTQRYSTQYGKKLRESTRWDATRRDAARWKPTLQTPCDKKAKRPHATWRGNKPSEKAWQCDIRRDAARRCATQGNKKTWYSKTQQGGWSDAKRHLLNLKTRHATSTSVWPPTCIHSKPEGLVLLY